MIPTNTTLVIGLCLMMTATLLVPSAAACLDLMPRTTFVTYTVQEVHEAKADAVECATEVSTAGTTGACV